MRDIDRPVVVLIERRLSDEAVMREARVRVVAEAAPLVLVHVAPLGQDLTPWGFRAQRRVEPWQRMLGLEVTVSYDLRLLAREWIGPATRVDVVVRFGDAVTELAAVADVRGAACHRPLAAGALAIRVGSGWPPPADNDRAAGIGANSGRTPLGGALPSDPGRGPVASVSHRAPAVGRPGAMHHVKRVALVAHDHRKQDLLEWAAFNRAVLAAHALYATATTGTLLREQLGLEVTALQSGPLGGDQQIGARIAEGKIDFLIFFWDPLQPQPHDPDVKALVRIAVVWNIPVACNRASADFIISSPLLIEPYERRLPDHAGLIALA